MPATHPFAIKLEQAILDATRLRDSLRDAKKKADDAKKDPVPRNGGGGGGDGGGRKALPGKRPDPPKDPQYARLKAAYDKARSRCNERYLKANAAYHRCLASPNGSAESCRGLHVGVACPEVAQAWEALSAYVVAQAGGSIGPSQSNSGGGGGGGF